MTSAVPFNDLLRIYEMQRSRIDAALHEVLDTGWYVLGPRKQMFEQRFARYCGAKGSIGVGSGTDALELALRAVGCGPGREVIVAGNAGGYGSLACAATGGTPVVADIEFESLLLDPEKAALAVTDRTCAVIVTHLYGLVADVDAVRSALPDHVKIIEDGSQAHGGERGGKRVGGMGDLAAFSFYPTKNLGALGDAGAVTGTDLELLDRVRHLHQYGWEKRYHAIVPGGRNSRLDEVQAAVLLVRLADLDQSNAERVEHAQQIAKLSGLDDRFVHSAASEHGQYVGHLCVVRHPNRNRLEAALAARGVATAVHFPHPDHLQPALRNIVRSSGTVSVTEEACGAVLSVPCFAGMTVSEREYVAASLREVW